jgi:predicted ABC-type transport system involved in lysophospholipase L1 biosynthesis ATPase subunit
MQLLLDVHRVRQATLVLVTHDAALAALADFQLSLRDGRPVDAASRGTDLHRDPVNAEALR